VRPASVTADVTPDELLDRIAGALRHEIGPEVGEPFAKTQAFMASVVLEKLARQYHVADAHERADRADRDALAHDLRTHMKATTPPRVRAAVAALGDGGAATLCELVEALYATRAELGVEQFDVFLARVRETLRARLDRQLEYAS
jgi:hypothetical protein